MARIFGLTAAVTVAAALWASQAGAAPPAHKGPAISDQFIQFFAAPQPDAKLPKVLLIGDSIVNGYRGAVAERLKGVANVDAWVTGENLAGYKLHDHLLAALSHGPYSVVHFNIGLHGWQPGRIPKGKYEPLLREYIAVLKQHAGGAKLIWGSTTPITVRGHADQLDPDNNPTITRRNAIAARVMKENGIEVDDLYTLMSDKLKLGHGDKFHWTAPAIAIQADQASNFIRKALGTGEPDGVHGGTHADDAKTKAKAAQAELDTKFHAWVATRPPEQQVWEKVLMDNLGGFYLPIYEKQKLQNRESAWDYVKDDPKLPRVLLIGDSVSRGYTQSVRHDLASKVNVHRAPENCGPSSNGLKKLDIYLDGGHWALIHFNFGIHDVNRKVTPEQYAANLQQIVDRLKSTGAKIVWASTTPLNTSPEKRDEVVKFNAIAAQLMKKNGVAIDDLYTAILPHVGQWQHSTDRTHFNTEGYKFLGKTVADDILKELGTNTAAR